MIYRTLFSDELRKSLLMLLGDIIKMIKIDQADKETVFSWDFKQLVIYHYLNVFHIQKATVVYSMAQ